MRSWILLSVLAAMLVLVAACGDDDSDAESDAAESDTVSEASDDPAPTQEPEPTATATPEPTPEPDPTETPAPTETEAPEEEAEDPAPDDAAEQTEDEGQQASQDGQSGELDALLLTVDDMPADWTETSMEMETEAEVGDIAEDPFEAPCGVEPLEDAFNSVAEAQRSFQGTELGPFLSQNLVQLESSEDAAQSMDHIRELFGCEEWVETDEFGEEMTFEITESDVEGVGDSSLGIRLGLSFADEPEMEMFGEFGFDMIFFQRDEFVSMLMYVDIFGMGDLDFQGMAQRADERLQAGQ